MITGALSSISSCFCPKPQNYTLQSKLVYADSQEPLIDNVIKIYTQRQCGFKHFIGTVNTHDNGELNVKFSLVPSTLCCKQTLIFEIFRKDRPFQEHGLPGFTREVRVGAYAQPFKSSVLDQNLGIIKVAIDSIPKDISKIPKPLSYEMPDRNYYWRLISASKATLIKKLIVFLFQKCLTTHHIQQLYSSFGTQFPKPLLTEETLLDLLLTGICAVGYKIDDNGDIVFEANWDDFEFDPNKPKSLPNVTIHLRKDEDGKLPFKKIMVNYKGDDLPTVYTKINDKIKENKDEDEKQITIQKHQLPTEAIYKSISALSFLGELKIHLGQGHLFPWIIVENWNKSISDKNPLYPLVKPFTKYLGFIDYFGGMGVIFGNGSVLEISALSEKGIKKALVASMKECADFIHYRPQEPLTNSPRERAALQKAFYNTFYEYVTKVIADHAHQFEVGKSEIYNFSQSLHAYWPVFPKIMPVEHQFGAEEKENLARCVALLLCILSYSHWSAHSRQEVLTHLDVASLGMRNFGMKNGKLDPYGNMLPADADKQLSTSYILMNFESVKLIEYIPEDLLELLKSNKDIPTDILNKVFGRVEI